MHMGTWAALPLPLFCLMESSSMCDSSTTRRAPPTGSADVQGTVSAGCTQDSTSTGLELHAWPLFWPADL